MNVTDFTFLKSLRTAAVIALFAGTSTLYAEEASKAPAGKPPKASIEPAQGTDELPKAAAQPAEEVIKRAPGRSEQQVAGAVVRLFLDGHFSTPKFRDEESAALFDEYFEALDPNRIYFLAEDLERLSPWRLVLDHHLPRGNIDFPFKVYATFLERVQERIDYARERLKTPFDFSIDESLAVDRSQKPWAADKAELDEIWRKRIKNQMLIENMIREAGDEKKDGESKEKDEKSRKWLSKRTPEETVLRRYQDYFRLLNNNDTYDVIENFITIFTKIFDPHSSYMNWRTEEDFNIDMSLSLQGIGAVLTSRDGYTEVVRIIPGGPVDKDGRLKPGDRIVAVSQGDKESVDTVNIPLHKVVRMIRGKKGTTVNLTVIKSIDSVPELIDIVRDDVELEDSAASGELKVVKDAAGNDVNIAYVYLPSFYADWGAMRDGNPDAKRASGDVRKILNKLKAEHQVHAIVIDLRGDGGGSLEEAIDLAGLFIPSGPIVQVKQGRGQIREYEDDDGNFAYKLPMVVAVDKTSASASEIFAGAIQDYERGIIVGDRTTHGKGTVQTVLRLNKYEALSKMKPGALKYTMAKFYRITGHSTQKKGITPDIIFPSFFDHMEIGEADLKHVMPWDEIPPMRFNKHTQPVSPYLPRIKANSAKRVADNNMLQVLFEDIRRYGVRRQMKELSLNAEERRKLRKEDDYWAKRTNEILFRDRSQKKDEEDEEAKKEEKLPDLYLEEILNIAADLVQQPK